MVQGLKQIAIASAKIHAGMADCIVAGGTESMSLVPVGWKTVLNYGIAKDHPDWYSSMGATAESVSTEFNISREDQDEFALHSHQKAVKAIKEGKFKSPDRSHYDKRNVYRCRENGKRKSPEVL